jgi:hypothetical protein
VVITEALRGARARELSDCDRGRETEARLMALDARLLEPLARSCGGRGGGGGDDDDDHDDDHDDDDDDGGGGGGEWGIGILGL